MKKTRCTTSGRLNRCQSITKYIVLVNLPKAEEKEDPGEKKEKQKDKKRVCNERQPLDQGAISAVRDIYSWAGQHPIWWKYISWISVSISNMHTQG